MHGTAADPISQHTSTVQHTATELAPEEGEGEEECDPAVEAKLMRSLSNEQKAQMLQDVFPDMKLGEVLR